MKIIDKYLIKQFLQTVIFALMAFTLIFIVIDMMENIDDFIDQNVPNSVILHYYFVFSPEIIRLITPVAVLFGALFTAGKAANLSELTAIKASGVSLFRFMLPFLITSFLISMFSVYFSGYLVPMANATKNNIERQYLNRGYQYSGGNIFFQDAKNRIVSISFYDESRAQAVRTSVHTFNTNDLTRMTGRIDADRLHYDTISGIWTAYNGVKRSFDGSGETASYFDSVKLEYLNFKPKELLSKQQKPEQMDFTQLSELIDSQSRAGSDPTNALIEFHSRIAFSLTSIIVVFFGLPISANRRKGGLAVQVGISILVTFIYLVFMKISQAYGKNGVMDPFLTAWISNFLFLGIALINLPRVRQ